MSTLTPSAHSRDGTVHDGTVHDGNVLPDPRLAPHVAWLAARLGPACRHLDPPAFQALVERIARTQLRWRDEDGRAAPGHA